MTLLQSREHRLIGKDRGIDLDELYTLEHAKGGKGLSDVNVTIELKDYDRGLAS